MTKILEIKDVVSVKWLNNHLKDENLLLFNATIPKVNGGVSKQLNVKIPGACFFDIKNKFSDLMSPFPNTIPTLEQFQNNVQMLGLNNNSVVVVYDDYGIYSSARAWWLLKTFGFKNVAILNGGLPEWKAKEYPLEAKDECNKLKPKKGTFRAKYNSENVVLFKSLNVISKDENFKIIDARSSNRFNCIVPEPRKGLRSGTIPASLNLPYNEVLNNNNLKSEKELQSIFSKFATKNQHLVFSCGSGITASILALAATVAGYKNSVYDGSWTEYGTLKKV